MYSEVVDFFGTLNAFKTASESTKHRFAWDGGGGLKEYPPNIREKLNFYSIAAENCYTFVPFSDLWPIMSSYSSFLTGKLPFSELFGHSCTF